MITFTPLIDPYGKVLDWRWRDQLAMCLGDYSVTLNALSGEATSADWTLASMADDNAYMENTWGQAQAYGVKILPWVQALLKKTRPIIDRYPESDVLWFSIEDAAAYDQAFRDAGFDASLHDHALPQTGDVPYDQALSLAKEVFTSDCGMSDASFGAYTKTIEYTAQETKLWQIRYYNANYMYTVILDAKTGEVQLAELTNSAAGNG